MLSKLKSIFHKPIINDDYKINFLKDIIRQYNSQGDNYYAYKDNKDIFRFGYTNDYPLQHGKGEEFKLPNTIVELLIKR